MQTWWV